MPLACAIAFSSGVVMKPATTEGAAPYSMVVTVTTAFSVRGYCSTGKELTARNPSTRIIRLTTVASTGRRMKMSVNFMAPAPLLVGYVRVRIVGRRHRVVDHHRRVIVQLDLAGRDDDIPRLDTLEDCNLVAARVAGRHEGLLGDQLRLALRVLALVEHHIDGVAIRIVRDG